jgi:hypothetical protein
MERTENAREEIEEESCQKHGDDSSYQGEEEDGVDVIEEMTLKQPKI